jgi:four helix bundle protein
MIKDFTDLRVWQASRELAVLIYTKTDSFPNNEIYGITSQIRRAVISVSSNIAEGFGRKSGKDKEHFYVMSAGSLFELKNQIIISEDLGFISKEDSVIVVEKIDSTHRQLNALLKTHRNSDVQRPASNV